MKISRIFLSLAVVAAMTACSGNTSDKDSDSKDKKDKVENNCLAKSDVKSDASSEDIESMEDHGSVLVLDGANNNIEATTHPVVIDFNATWCGPCQQFGPVFHKVADEYSDKAVFASADVDVCTELAAKYEVSSIPAIVIIYPGDREPVSTVGYMNELDFKAFLDNNL